MTHELAEQIIADTPEFLRLTKKLERAHAAWKQNPSEAAARRFGDALIALGEHCHKMNAYLRPVADALEMLATPRRKRGKTKP